MLNCDHCLLEISENKAVHDEIKGVSRVFCCYGCKGVYRLINEEGLGEFYNRRESVWTPGPPEEIIIEPSAFDDVLRRTGNMIEADIILDGIRCASCIWLIEKVLLRMKGVIYAKVNYATHRAKIRWDPAKIDLRGILARITSIGYAPKSFVANAHEEQAKREQRDLLMRFGTAAFFSMQLMLYSIALYAGYFHGIGSGTKTLLQLISLLVATPVMFYSGMPLIKGSIRGLRSLSFNMDVLIVTGASSAYFYSIYGIFAGGEVYFDTSAMIITLILLGRYIETGAKRRANEVITKLLSLNPKEARIVRSLEQETESLAMAPISSINAGDMIRVKPGERIPLDGNVIEGASEVDESMLTGESKPVSKISGSEVFCGTQNLYGSFVFQVKKTGPDTVLSHIIRVVEDAQARQAPVHAIADRVVGIFVPFVLILSAITGFWWFYFEHNMAGAFMNAVSVLVIACPCALGLATPLAILAGTTRGASKGILIKGGDVIECMKKTDTVVLDKTGTLTEGRQELTAYRGVGIPDKEALRLASSLEDLSEHSISRAILAAYKGNQLFKVTGFAALPGKGLSGTIEGKNVILGSRIFIEAEELSVGMDEVLSDEMYSWVIAQEKSGATVVYLTYGRKLSGIFIVSDKLRQEAGETVKTLRQLKHDVMMITGDSKSAAAGVASKVHLNKDSVMAQRSPVEKVEAIRFMQEKGKNVVMAGDGINDAPALIQAVVGIAVGRATDIALESADIVLMKNDLTLIPEAIVLSKKIYAVIRQNLFLAFIYNLTALPLAMMGVLHPIVAALAMTLSSLSVVGNSARLKRA